MIIRSFIADSVSAALKDVRAEMGGDAVVLKTRKVTGGGGIPEFEVTACLDKPTAAQAEKVLRNDNSRLPQSVTAVAEAPAAEVSFETPVEESQASVSINATVADTSALEERLTEMDAKIDQILLKDNLATAGVSLRLGAIASAVTAMRSADVPEQFIATFFNTLRENHVDTDITEDLVRNELTNKISDYIESESAFAAGDRVVVMGPAGSGKTSTVGKLASSLVMQRKAAIKLMTLDSYKVGALDEIESYGDMLGITVADPTILLAQEPSTENNGDNDKVLLVDTGALVLDDERIAGMKEQLDRIKPTHRLVVISTMIRSTDIERICKRIESLEPTALVFSMTDLTDCWGAMITAAEATGLKIVLTADSSSGTGQLRTPDASEITTRILGEEVNNG